VKGPHRHRHLRRPQLTRRAARVGSVPGNLVDRRCLFTQHRRTGAVCGVAARRIHGTYLGLGWVGLGWVGLAVAVAGCDVEGFDPPEGSTEVDGVHYSPFDNPVVTGTVNGIVVADRGPPPTLDSRYSALETITPTIGYAMADRGGVIPDPWTWEGDQTYVPRVFLPWREGATEVGLWVRRGRTRTEPVPPGTIPLPIGFDDELLDTIRVELDPDVLLLPVRVHLFARPQSAEPFPWATSWPRGIRPDGEFFGQVFDPGPARTLSQESMDDGFQSTSTVRSAFYGDDIHSFAVDQIWAQCGIQFRLEELEVLFSPEGYWDEYDGCSSFSPLVPSEYRAGRSGSAGVDVFVGGDLGDFGCPPDGFGEEVGFTTGPSNLCERQPSTTAFNRISLSGPRMWSRRNVIAHELGHYLGLGHVGDTMECLPVSDTDGIENGLMFSGGGGPDPVLTPAQCETARCLAARWLARWGRMSPTEAVTFCVGG